ncbi:MAG: BrnA antitoxin family protein [Magnetococcales bacterium]|nr:BrnA antitoxin family protein [Magnetococcales bacterium]
MSPKILMPTDEEEAAINAGIAADPDNPEWTEEDFARARPANEMFPEIVAAYRRGDFSRPPRIVKESSDAELPTLPLAREVYDYFRAAGPDWRERVHQALREWMAAHPLV